MMAANHGDFLIMHKGMLHQFAAWRDEMYLREFGFRISELQEQEALVARLLTVPDPTDEVKAERDRVVKTYNEVWRPRRILISMQGG